MAYNIHTGLASLIAPLDFISIPNPQVVETKPVSAAAPQKKEEEEAEIINPTEEVSDTFFIIIILEKIKATPHKIIYKKRITI